MYFMDFASSGLISKSCRYFLSGDNDYLKNYVIDRLARETGRKITRVSSVKEIQPEGLFEVEKLFILPSKSNPKTFQDYTVKLSKSKMGKTYKDAGFIEVTCSSLFPNQVGQFASLLLSLKGMPKTHSRSIARLAKYDPYSVYNTIEALSYLNKKLTAADVGMYAGYLSTPDVFKMIDYFIEGNYVEFLTQVEDTKINIHEILWALLGTLLKLQQAVFDAQNAVSWYQKKMLEAGSKIAPFGFPTIITYVNGMCTAYNESRAVLVLKLQRLIYYLSGLADKL